jgi:hypothetical protein
MFFKYASSVLQEISDECMLKSFACENREIARIYEGISSRIDWIITRIGVEEKVKPRIKE